jgi:hypothetical protein
MKLASASSASMNSSLPTSSSSGAVEIAAQSAILADERKEENQ